MLERSAVTQAPPAGPGQPPTFFVEAWRMGRGWRLGPFDSQAEALAVLGVVEAKAQQLAGDALWVQGLDGLEPKWVEQIELASWEGLLELLGDATELERKAAMEAPPAQPAPAPGRAPAESQATDQQADAATAEPEQPAADSAPPPGEVAASSAGAQPQRSSQFRGVSRDKHKGILRMKIRAAAWGTLRIHPVASEQLGAKLYDWAAIWRAMRQAQGVQVSSSGRPSLGACLPAPPPGSLQPLLNSPPDAYLGDADLMAFLGQASFAELEARLRAEAAGTAGGEAPKVLGGEGASADAASDDEEQRLEAGDSAAAGSGRRAAGREAVRSAGGAPSSAAGSRVPALHQAQAASGQKHPTASGFYGVRVKKGGFYLQISNAWGDVRVPSVPSAELAARLWDWAQLWRAMRKAPVAQLGPDGCPSGAPGSCLPLPAKLPAREYSMNFPPSAYSGDAVLLAFLGSASLGELAERLGREAGCAVSYSIFSSGEDKKREEGEDSSSSEEEAAAGAAVAQPRRPYTGVEARMGGKFVALLGHGGADHKLGEFESAEAAACARDVGVVWRQMQKNEPLSKAPLTLPQLCLPGNAMLLNSLWEVPDIPGLVQFLKSWAQKEMPALLAGLAGNSSGQESPTAQGAAAAHQPSRQRQRKRAASDSNHSASNTNTPAAKQARAVEGAGAVEAGGGADGASMGAEALALLAGTTNRAPMAVQAPALPGGGADSAAMDVQAPALPGSVENCAPLGAQAPALPGGGADSVSVELQAPALPGGGADSAPMGVQAPALPPAGPAAAMPVLLPAGPAAAMPALLPLGPNPAMPALSPAGPAAAMPALLPAGPAPAMPALLPAGPALALPPEMPAAPTSAFDMLDAMQPLLERVGVEAPLLSAFELAFLDLQPAAQRYLARALPRAVAHGGRAAAEQLLRNGLKGAVGGGRGGSG